MSTNLPRLTAEREYVVLDSLSYFVRSLIEGILPLYKNLEFAYLLAGLMVFAATLLIGMAIAVHFLRAAALQNRTRRITSFVSFGSRGSGARGADDREQQFASRFDEIDASLRAGGPMSGGLEHAWRRYSRTLTSVGAPPIRSSQRPNGFFYAATPPPTWLGFAANIFVAMGLLATFLGLVAALTFAAQGMASDDMNAMQNALRDLLSAAASKFVTSIAGVSLSIILRLVERILTMDLRGRLDRLSSAIELGVRVENDAHSAAVADRISALVDRISGTKEAV